MDGACRLCGRREARCDSRDRFRQARQGKTFLLRALCEATGGFYFAADEATDSDSLHQIGAALGAHLGLTSGLRFDSWHEVLDALLALGNDQPTTVVIDEFPYLARANPSLPSIRAECARAAPGAA